MECASLPGTIPILTMKVLYPRKAPSPRQTWTLGPQELKPRRCNKSQRVWIQRSCLLGSHKYRYKHWSWAPASQVPCRKRPNYFVIHTTLKLGAGGGGAGYTSTLQRGMKHFLEPRLLYEKIKNFKWEISGIHVTELGCPPLSSCLIFED